MNTVFIKDEDWTKNASHSSLCDHLWSNFCTLRYWWAQVDSNHRPRAYQARALTTWAMSPCNSSVCALVSLAAILELFNSWWRWGESNPWPPACRAGALPAELHPHLASLRHDLWKLNSVERISRLGCIYLRWARLDCIQPCLLLSP